LVGAAGKAVEQGELLTYLIKTNNELLIPKIAAFSEVHLKIVTLD